MKKAKIRFLVSVAMVAASLSSASSVALAQTTADEPAEETEILVTGSRLQRELGQGAAPITSVTGDAIAKSGDFKVTDYLAGVPGLTGSFTSTESAFSADVSRGETGLNLLDLRFLGTGRTLVLIDGKRQVASVPGQIGVDINTIPSNMIERVEVITGGASAVYGADAVSGAVNFITRSKFSGVQLNATAGISERGDAAEYLVSALVGTSFGGGSGNIVGSVEYYSQDRLKRYTRKISRETPRVVDNPIEVLSGIDDPNVPDQVVISNPRIYYSSTAGVFDLPDSVAALLGPEYVNPDGVARGTVVDGIFRPFDAGLPLGSQYGQGGEGTPENVFMSDLVPSTERFTAALKVNYEFSPAVDVFADARYVSVKAFAQGAGIFDSGIRISVDNPYMPQSLRNLLTAAGEDGIDISSREHTELGRVDERAKRDLFRVIAGLRGQISGEWKYEVSGNYGRSELSLLQSGQRLNDRFAAAVDAVIDPDSGNVVCRSNIDPTAVPPSIAFPRTREGFLSFTPGPNSGCAPINILGRNGISPQALDFVITQTRSTALLQQTVLSGVITGNTSAWLNLPGGPVGVVLGTEYRKEKSQSVIDDNVAQNLIWAVSQQSVRGSYDVKEIFGEIGLPILKDLPLIKSLTIEGAVRLSDYSTTGTSTTWRVNGDWEMFDGLRFRGTYSTATRAPNINELVSPGQLEFVAVDDPCSVENLDLGSPTRAANCAALGIPADYQQVNIGAVPGSASGNPNLRAETAKTFTLGAVLKPNFLPGFTASVDYYSIKINDAIALPDGQTAIDRCVDGPTLDPVFCDLLSRAPASDPLPYRVSDVRLSQQNIGALKTTGIDVQISYLQDLRDLFKTSEASLTLSLAGSHLLKFNEFPFASDLSIVDKEAGETFRPRYVLNMNAGLSVGTFGLNYNLQYQSGQLYAEREDFENQPDYLFPRKSRAQMLHDLSISASVNDKFEATLGVANLTDEQPDLLGEATPYDVIGRRYFLSIKAKY
jgi:iron complex outermembrane recepter protein